MKKIQLLLTFALVLLTTLKAQSNGQSRNVKITSLEEPISVSCIEKGELLVNVSNKEVQYFKIKGEVYYSDFGAIGDGKTDDMDAIAGTHAFANQHKLKVKANKGATYYLGSSPRTAIIQTDTDFGTAAFIIDDAKAEKSNASVFLVSSNQKSMKLENLTTLKRNQPSIDLSLTGTSIITVNDSNVKQFIRLGGNQDSGASQTDIFIVDKDGKVDQNTPIIWDFNQITDAMVIPMDESLLTISGGRFTTIANAESSKFDYYNRNIVIKRSNVLVTGLEHRITGESEMGAPYGGFIYVNDCANVKIENTLLTGHKVYNKIGRAGVTVPMGSYDVLLNHALNVSLVNCKQTNDINDSKYWGIFASNYSKNILFDNCTFSRFDAHKGVANATIRNSTLGHQGINAIGCGTLTIENSKIYANNLVNLRSDYGSSWQGEVIIRNTVFAPKRKSNSINLIGGSYSGLHDFGYSCYAPERITIENLSIDDVNLSASDKELYLFENFNPKMMDESYKENFPYIRTKEVILKNVTTTSGKKLLISNNAFMFKDVKVIRE
jgi:hypothetical protein